MDKDKVAFKFTAGTSRGLVRGTWKATRSSASGAGSNSGNVQFKFVAVPDGDDVLGIKQVSHQESMFDDIKMIHCATLQVRE